MCSNKCFLLQFNLQPRCCTDCQQYCINTVPEIIPRQKAVVLSLFDSNIDGSAVLCVRREVTDVDGFVTSRDLSHNLHQKPQQPAAATHHQQLAVIYLRQHISDNQRRLAVRCRRRRLIQAVDGSWRMRSEQSGCHVTVTHIQVTLSSQLTASEMSCRVMTICHGNERYDVDDFGPCHKAIDSHRTN